MQRPSEIEDIYARLGVSRESCTPEHLTYVYRQKCMVWNPDINKRVTSDVDIDALREAYDAITFHLKTQRVIKIAEQEMAKGYRPVGKRPPVNIVQCLQNASVEARIGE
jgi:curved DNA-binding protein CbpA